MLSESSLSRPKTGQKTIIPSFLLVVRCLLTTILVLLDLCFRNRQTGVNYGMVYRSRVQIFFILGEPELARTEWERNDAIV